MNSATRWGLLCLLGWAQCAAPAMATDAPLPAMTRRVVLERIETGYRWKLIEAQIPKVGEHQILLHVRAVSLNRGDLEILEPDAQRDHTGLLVASDAAGDIVATGKLVRGLRNGMRITSTYFRNYTDGPPDADKLAGAHGASIDGVLGDYVLLDETSVTAMPAGLTYEEAATLPTAGLTGWMATLGQRGVGKADTVLVQGTGGVSVFSLQFAAAAGAHVIVTSSSDDKLAHARSIGAGDGINYRSIPAWSDRVLEITHGHGADIVVDVGGKETLAQSVKSLAFGGTLSIVGGLSGYDGLLPATRLLARVARAQGIFVGSRADFRRMNEFIAVHALHPVIDRVYPLEQYEEALKQMRSGNFVGKIVFRL